MYVEEIFPLVDEEGNITGKATRKECHAGTFLLHPVVHLHVLNSKGELYLQKRAYNKDIQPGKWDTAVGGHVDFGEDIVQALYREAGEELGIMDFTPLFMFRYKFVSDIEAELVHSYYTIYDGMVTVDPVEIAEGKYWALNEINAQLGNGIFTPNFTGEFQRILRDKSFPL